MKIITMNPLTKEKTVCDVHVCPNQLFQEMNNWWSGGRAGGSADLVFAKTLILQHDLSLNHDINT